MRTLLAVGAPLLVSLLGACAVASDGAPQERKLGEASEALPVNPIAPPIVCPIGSHFVLGQGCVRTVLPPVVAATGLRYDQIQQIDSHNSYETNSDTISRVESLFDQLAFHHVRSLELDIHRDSDPPAQFQVYHEGGDHRGPSCPTLAACLGEVRSFHDQNPQHEVVTVFIEPKDGDWVAGHLPADLDTALIQGVGAENIFTPQMLHQTCPGQTTLQGVVGVCDWPTLTSLRGKILFVVMQTKAPGQQGDSMESTVESYEQNNGTTNDPTAAFARTAFIALDPGNLTDPNSVFANFNESLEDALNGLGANVPAAVRSRIVTRNVPTDGVDYANNRANGIRHLGTEKVNGELYPAFTTRNARGWPFEPIPGIPSDVSAMADDERVVRLAVTSGDIENESDDFGFAFIPGNDSGVTEWSAFLAGAADSGNTWAKACLMARQTLDADSPYFAVCRPNGNHPMRVQYRAHKGDDTTIREFTSADVLSGSVTAAISATPNGAQVCMAGSVNGGAESILACFDGGFPLQGIAVGGHGDTDRKFLFGNLQRTDSRGGWQPIVTSQLSAGVAIGAGAVVTQLADGSW